MTVSKLIPQRIRNLQSFPTIEERLTEDETFFQEIMAINQRVKSEDELSNKITELSLNEIGKSVSDVLDGGIGVYIFCIEDELVDSLLTFTVGLNKSAPFEVILKSRGVSIENARTLVNFLTNAMLEANNIEASIEYLRGKGHSSGLRFLETTYSVALGDNFEIMNEIHALKADTPVVLVTNTPEENLRLV